MSILHLRQHAYTRWSKRAFDIVAALIALVLAAPVIAVIALILAPSGHVLYRQTRLGEREALHDRQVQDDGGWGREGGARWSSDDDSRVTRVGRVLRRAHLDRAASAAERPPG